MAGSTLSRHLSRRRLLQGTALTLGVASVPVLAACAATPPTATPAPAKPAAPAPAATTAPAAKPTAAAAAKPAATTAPAAKPTAAAAAKPTAAAAAKPTAAAKPAAKPTPGPSQTVQGFVAALPKGKTSAQVTGKLQILQNQDFHPDHNAFVRLMLEEWGKSANVPMDISYISGFQGGSDLNQKLVAMVQAGTPPDIMDHNVSHQQQVFLGVLEDVSNIVQENEKQFGKTVVGIARGAQVEGKWYGVPYYTRAGGYYVRKDVFTEAGLDVDKDTETYNKMREAALKVSDPDKKRWGWGMTVNRSGDGESMVQNLVFAHGGRVQDEAGKKIVFNSPETVAGVEWAKETYTDPKWARALPPGVNAWNDISNNEAFLAGTIMITQNAGTMLAKAYFDKVPHANSIVVVQTPKSLDGKGPRLESGGGETLRIIKGSKNRQAAEDLINYWTSQPVQETIWKISTAYALPAYNNGWDNPIIKGNENSIKFKPVVNNEDWWGMATPGPIQAAVDAIGSANIFTDMMGAVLKGTPPKQAVEDAHRRMVKIFKEFGLPGE